MILQRGFICILSFMISVVALCGSAVAQPGLQPELRATVYRIVTPEGRYGTAMSFKYYDRNFFITNKHVIVSDSVGLHDSIFVFLNATSQNHEVISTTEHRTIRLASDSSRHVFFPVDSGVDLALISIGTGNADLSAEDSITFCSTAALIGEDRLSAILSPSGIITVVGYPSKVDLPLHVPWIPEYRWGRYVGRNPRFIVSDTPIRRGSSGSPALIQENESYYLVGFVTAVKDGKCLITPVSAVRDQFREYFSAVDALSQHGDTAD